MDVLITGTSTGFGHRTALRLAREGHRVFATMREAAGRNRAHAEELSRAAADERLDLSVSELNVTDEASVERAVSDILGRGTVDILINNAGIWGPGVLEAFPLDQWQKVFEVNLFGSVRMARAVLPAMRARGSGLIVQISSLQGRFILPYSGPYVASKFAVEGAFETFRYEVAPFGIEIAIVEPYDFMTEMKDKARDNAARDPARADDYGVQDFLEQAYLHPDPQRSGDPEQVVDAIAGLIARPAGERPLRLPVANPLRRIDEINRLTDDMHRELYPQIGLAHLLQPRGRPDASARQEGLN